MSNISKAIKLQEAIDKLHEADALMQEALGASEECYSLHNVHFTHLRSLFAMLLL